MKTLALLAMFFALPGCSWLCGDVVPKHTVREIKVQTDTIFEEYLKVVEKSDLHAISKDAAKVQVEKANTLITEAAK